MTRATAHTKDTRTIASADGNGIPADATKRETTMNWTKLIPIVLDIIMLVFVLIYACLHMTFSPFAMGCWVVIALLLHLKELNDDD